MSACKKIVSDSVSLSHILKHFTSVVIARNIALKGRCMCDIEMTCIKRSKFRLLLHVRLWHSVNIIIRICVMYWSAAAAAVGLTA